MTLPTSIPTVCGRWRSFDGKTTAGACPAQPGAVLSIPHILRALAAMPEKSEHKQAWQTAQRALRAARNAEAAAKSTQPAPTSLLQRLSWLGPIVVAMIAVAGVIYRFYPSIEIRPVDGDVSANPAEAEFSFRNVGRLSVSGAVVTCRLNTPQAKDLIMSGNLATTPTGIVGQQFGRFDPGSPPVVRSCATTGIQIGMTHPSTISVDVSWYSLPIGHQYFVSQPVTGNKYRMVPESGPL
jgi:hypothetical protein